MYDMKPDISRLMTVVNRGYRNTHRGFQVVEGGLLHPELALCIPCIIPAHYQLERTQLACGMNCPVQKYLLLDNRFQVQDLQRLPVRG